MDDPNVKKITMFIQILAKTYFGGTAAPIICLNQACDFTLFPSPNATYQVII